MTTDVPCPFCGEMIKPAARKCRFCNEFLEPGLTREAILEKRVADQAAQAVSATPAPSTAPQTPPTAVAAEPAETPAPAAESTPPAAPTESPAPEAEAQAAVTASVLAGLYEKIGQLPDSPERTKLVETLKALESKTDADDESGVEDMVKTVMDYAPDVAEIAISTLINPASGLTTLVQKVAVRVAESKKQ